MDETSLSKYTINISMNVLVMHTSFVISKISLLLRLHNFYYDLCLENYTRCVSELQGLRSSDIFTHH